MGLQPKKSTRGGPLTAHYSIEGEGTPASPAVVFFNFSPALGPGVEAIQEVLPKGYKVELEGIGYKLSSTPARSVAELTTIFKDLANEMKWIRRYRS